MKKHAAVGKRVLLAVLALFLLGMIAVFFAEPLRDVYEMASVQFFPNADRAVAYGERHLTSSDAAAYNVNLAEYFFEKAWQLNPNLPYVDHELARINFLKGNFSAALVDINLQIDNHGDQTANSYYVRGLIEGYMGDYADAANDYEHFLAVDPHNWAGINDYAWVLLKAGRAHKAADVTLQGLQYFPDNPWLLNSNSIALSEIGDLKDAYSQAKLAVQYSQTITQQEWLHSYPGNDPAIAALGIATFKTAALDNMHSIERALATSTVQSTQQ